MTNESFIKKTSAALFDQINFDEYDVLKKAGMNGYCRLSRDEKETYTKIWEKARLAAAVCFPDNDPFHIAEISQNAVSTTIDMVRVDSKKK